MCNISTLQLNGTVPRRFTPANACEHASTFATLDHIHISSVPSFSARLRRYEWVYGCMDVWVSVYVCVSARMNECLFFTRPNLHSHRSWSFFHRVWSCIFAHISQLAIALFLFCIFFPFLQQMCASKRSYVGCKFACVGVCTVLQNRDREMNETVAERKRERIKCSRSR